MFPTWPAKSELTASEMKARKAASPKPPSGGGAYKMMNDEVRPGISESIEWISKFTYRDIQINRIDD